MPSFSAGGRPHPGTSSCTASSCPSKSYHWVRSDCLRPSEWSRQCSTSVDYQSHWCACACSITCQASLCSSYFGWQGWRRTWPSWATWRSYCRNCHFYCLVNYHGVADLYQHLDCDFWGHLLSIMRSAQMVSAAWSAFERCRGTGRSSASVLGCHLSQALPFCKTFSFHCSHSNKRHESIIIIKIQN